MPADLDIHFDLSAQLAMTLLPRAQAVLEDTAKEVVAGAQAAIEEGSKTGRVYLHGPEPLPHQASAPGEAPANWTGALKDSITYTQTGELEIVVSVGEEHGEFLEFGTVHMAPRPFLAPTVDEVRPRFEERMAALLEKEPGR